jgi:hypothetical protein
VAAVGLESADRAALGEGWTFRGLSYVRHPPELEQPPLSIDVPAVDSTTARIVRLFPGPVDPDRLDDPAGRYLTSLLGCPMLASRAALGTAADSARLLASRCNFR